VGFGDVVICWCVNKLNNQISLLGNEDICLGKLYMIKVFESLVQNWRGQTIFGFGFEKRRMFKKRLWEKKVMF
jgi:hypothetical protein